MRISFICFLLAPFAFQSALAAERVCNWQAKVLNTANQQTQSYTIDRSRKIIFEDHRCIIELGTVEDKNEIRSQTVQMHCARKERASHAYSVQASVKKRYLRPPTQIAGKLLIRILPELSKGYQIDLFCEELGIDG